MPRGGDGCLWATLNTIAVVLAVLLSIAVLGWLLFLTIADNV